MTKRTRYTLFGIGIVISAFFWMLVAVWLINSVLPAYNSRSSADLFPASTSAYAPVQDPALVSLARELGLKKLNTVSLSYVDSYPEGNPNRGEYTFINNEKQAITILRGLDKEEEKRTLAHEYLHHVWEVSGLASDEKLNSELITSLASDPGMVDRTITYAENGTLSASELFSIYCTDSSDGYLKAYVLEKCNEHINRSLLITVR